MASTVFAAAPVPIPMMSMTRTRNNSCGSTGSSISSMSSSDSDSTPQTPVSPTQQQNLGPADLHVIASLLSGNTPTTESEIQAVKSLASRYKTELCRSYAETGICKYGDKCQFAHGNNEIKCLPRHPKYKSELCRTFHRDGFCPYGPRCHFIHSEDESKLTEINLMKQQAAARQATQQMLQQAARLRAQQHALQHQMQALRVSQFYLQIAQKNLKPTSSQVGSCHKPVYHPQMSVPVVPLTTGFNVLSSKPGLDRAVSLPAQPLAGNLTSVIDTPPITPPCGSPTFEHLKQSATAKMVSPPPGFGFESSSLPEQEVSSARVNLDFSSSENGKQSDAMNNFNIQDIVNRLHSMELDSVAGSDVYTPSTSPDSMLSSPMDSPRASNNACRLPVFSQIVA